MKFAKIAQGTAHWMGNPKTFFLAVFLVILWAATGPWFQYNEAWQLVINTSTTIVTFLMVFLIQNTQNRHIEMMHLKVNELLRVTKDAQNALLSMDNLDEHELHALRKKYQALGSGEVNNPVALPNNDSDLAS